MPQEDLRDFLDQNLILNSLSSSSIFSGNIIIHKRVDSTNLLAKEMASRGSPDGTVVLAEEQTAGRGRLERRWLSPGYVNLLFSILLRPSIPVERVFVLTMILAIAATDAVKAMAGLSALIKWPNDLYTGDRKFGGILTEFSTREGKIEYVILGLGLNVNWNPGAEEDTIYPATSIFAESGARVSRNDLLVAILKGFEDYYRQVLSGRIEALHERWNQLSMVTGKEVRIRSREGDIMGLALRIDPSGALIIRDEKGEERRILSGDVSLRA